MNSLERVLAAVNGKPTDRPAVSILLSLYGAKLTGCPLEEYYCKPDAYVCGQTAIRDTFRPDIIFSPFMLSAEGEAFGSTVGFFDDQAPNILRPAVRSAQEATRLSVPDIDSHARLLFIRESIQRLATLYKDEVPIVGVLLAPVDLPALIMGIDAWIDALLFHEKAAKQVLEITTTFFINWANALLSDGASLLAFPSLSNPGILTPKIVSEIAVPSYREAFSEVSGPLIMHHGGSRISPFLEYYASLPNLAGFVLDARDSFSEAREKIGPTKVLLGNIEGPTLCKLDAETVSGKCERILADRSGDRHFILSTSSADVAYETPPENIHAMVRAAENHT